MLLNFCQLCHPGRAAASAELEQELVAVRATLVREQQARQDLESKLLESDVRASIAGAAESEEAVQSAEFRLEETLSRVDKEKRGAMLAAAHEERAEAQAQVVQLQLELEEVKTAAAAVAEGSEERSSLERKAATLQEQMDDVKAANEEKDVQINELKGEFTSC